MCIILYIKSYLHNFFYRKSYVHKFFHFCISYTHNYSKVMCTILFSTEKNYMHFFSTRKIMCIIIHSKRLKVI